MRFFLQVTLVTLVGLMAVAINLPDGILVRIGLDATALKATLLVLIFVGLVVYRGLALIVLTAMVVLGASLPAELAARWGLDRQALFYTLLLLVAIPLYVRWRHGRSRW